MCTCPGTVACTLETLPNVRSSSVQWSPVRSEVMGVVAGLTSLNWAHISNNRERKQETIAISNCYESEPRSEHRVANDYDHMIT